jgi:putative ABC transport system permease protein
VITALVCVGVSPGRAGRLAAISPLRVLRSDLPLHSRASPLDYGLACCAVSCC